MSSLLAHEAGRVVELAALGEQRLVEEQARPVGELRVVGLQALDDARGPG